MNSGSLAEMLAGGRAVSDQVLHQNDDDNNESDLMKPPKPNFTEGGEARSTSVECVKKSRALVD